MQESAVVHAQHALLPALSPDGYNRAVAQIPLAPPRAPQPLTMASLAVRALAEEACLTPKPGLVDRRGSGAHRDMDLAMMLHSAHALAPCFQDIAKAAVSMRASQEARERLAVIGRQGEKAMVRATGGTNTHKGAIWTLGLLLAGAVMASEPGNPYECAAIAGALASFPDRRMPGTMTNGIRAQSLYGAQGARGQAERGFPQVVYVGLPALCASRKRGNTEDEARLDALVAIMADLDDTCLLHRGGAAMLHMVKTEAKAVCLAGGVATCKGQKKLERLEARMLESNASPGGSADLLAATMFLDALIRLTGNHLQEGNDYGNHEL